MSREKRFNPKQIARDLFDDLAYTVAVRDLEAHADCMSQSLVISGIPGVGFVDYTGWFSRRRNELTKPLLYSAAYKELNITFASESESEIHGSVQEVLKAMNGTVMVLEKVFTMRREADRWRLCAERIVNAEWRE